MSIKDLELLEKLLEDFVAKSDHCKDCPFKHYDENRQYCYFGVKCIVDKIIKM